MYSDRLITAIVLWCATVSSLRAEDLQDYSESVLGHSIPMVAVQGGDFWCTDYLPAELSPDAGRRWEVTVDSFWIGKYELRFGEYIEWVREQYRQPLDARLLRTLQYNAEMHGPTSGQAPPEYCTDNHPIVGIHQWNAKRYCHWLSLRTGKFYRLPTEAEWEFACRAGNTSSRYPWGDSPEQLSEYAVTATAGEEATRLQVVGTKQPNAWGIHDMLGNAEEWVADGYEVLRYRGRDNPMVWPASNRLSRDARGVWQEAQQYGERACDGWGVAKGGSHYWARCQAAGCFTVAARTNPSLISNDEDPMYSMYPQDSCHDLMANVDLAVGFRIARPASVPDRRTQLWHWGIYFDQEQWRDLTLDPTLGVEEQVP